MTIDFSGTLSSNILPVWMFPDYEVRYVESDKVAFDSDTKLIYIKEKVEILEVKSVYSAWLYWSSINPSVNPIFRKSGESYILLDGWKFSVSEENRMISLNGCIYAEDSSAELFDLQEVNVAKVVINKPIGTAVYGKKKTT